MFDVDVFFGAMAKASGIFRKPMCLGTCACAPDKNALELSSHSYFSVSELSAVLAILEEVRAISQRMSLQLSV